MTISELHLGVKQKLDKTSSLSLPSFTDEEIDWWLNDTIEVFIKQRIGGLNPKRTGFEETQKRIDDLRTLVVDDYFMDIHFPLNNGGWGSGKSYTLPTSSDDRGGYPNAYDFVIPSDYYAYVDDQVNLIEPNSESDFQRITVPSNYVTSDRYRIKLRDPFSEHNVHLGYAEPLRLMRDDRVTYIATPDYMVNNAKLVYIKKPDTVSLSGDITCNLPDHTHAEIVNMTAKRMLENIESPRYQTMSREVVEQE